MDRLLNLKTANVPTDYPYEEFKDIYLYAYEKGLKGCTTFRFNPEAFQGAGEGAGPGEHHVSVHSGRWIGGGGKKATRRLSMMAKFTLPPICSTR